MTWQLSSIAGLVLVLIAGFAWYERTRPDSRVVALVAALAALAVAGRLIFAPIPNVVATTDVALLTGYALGAAPGFAVGALAAPISNLWLGQGPWTVWQMGGWGLAGLVGAGLALLAGRRLGRLGLACACAAMGFAYGALLDFSVMVTYGGEQSLDRYLTLSARGLPFNVAHALGNFAIAYAAGPALVAMIERYRARLGFRWHPAGALPAALVAVALATAAVPPPAADAAGLGSARTWLEGAREPSGGYSATPGGAPSARMTGWAMLGLEAAGRNPLDVGRRGRTPIDYLESRRIRAVGDLELAILAIEGAGLDASRFAGNDLVAELRRRQRSDGSWQHQVNLTSYGLLALRAAGASSGVGSAASWLRDAQRDDGGWGFGPGQPSDPDSTGAAMQGLAAAGAGGFGEAIAYLRRTQRREGGWGLNETGVTNSQSTAWAVQGLVAAGVDPGRVETRGGRSGLDYLAARQRSDGSYAYNSASAQTPVWVTSQVLLAVSREALPVEAVPRSEGGPTAPSPDVEPGTEPPADTAPGAPGGAADRGDRARRGGDPKREGEKGNDGGRRERGPAEPAEPAAEVLAEAAGAQRGADEDADSTGPVVAAGLGTLALALGAGWFWYRRRLP